MIFKTSESEFEHDKGWSHNNHVWSKTMGSHVATVNLNTMSIEIDRWHYPIYNYQNSFSSFPFSGYSLIPYDHVVRNGTILHNPEETISLHKKTIDCDRFCDYIIQSVYKQLEGGQYIIGDSKGLDCTTIMSILDYFNIKYRTFCYDKRETNVDSLYKHLQETHWGFNQTAYFSEPTKLITGMYGDEYLLRNPLYVQWLLDDVNLSNVFEKYPNAYMYDYFKEYYCVKITNLQPNKNFLQNILNDYQLWSHFNTQVICPFKNINILQLGLNLDYDTIIKQVTDGYINKKIISMCNKKLLLSLDDKKNTSDIIF
jgi:hypothetical protein